MSFCQKCGNEIAKMDKYCRKCGNFCSEEDSNCYAEVSNKFAGNVMLWKITLVVGIIAALLCKYLPTTGKMIYQTSFRMNSDAFAFTVLLFISYILIICSSYMLLKTSELLGEVKLKKLVITVLIFMIGGMILGHILGKIWVSLGDEKVLETLKKSAAVNKSFKTAFVVGAMEMRIDALKELWRFVGMVSSLLAGLFICRDLNSYKKLNNIIRK